MLANLVYYNNLFKRRFGGKHSLYNFHSFTIDTLSYKLASNHVLIDVEMRHESYEIVKQIKVSDDQIKIPFYSNIFFSIFTTS